MEGKGEYTIRDLVQQRAAHAARPHRRRRVPRRRGARHAAGDEHRPRRLAHHHARQLARRGHRAPRDAGAHGRPRSADARHPRADRQRRSTSSCSRRASSTARARSPRSPRSSASRTTATSALETIFEFYRHAGERGQRARRVPRHRLHAVVPQRVHHHGPRHRRRVPMSRARRSLWLDVMLLLGVGAGRWPCSSAWCYGWTPVAASRRATQWRALRELGQRRAARALLAAARRATSRSATSAVVVAGLLVGGVILRLAGSTACVLAVFGAYVPVFWIERAAVEAAARRSTSSSTPRCSRWPTPSWSRRTSRTRFATIAQHFDPPISPGGRHRWSSRCASARRWTRRCATWPCAASSRNVDAIVTALTVGRQTGGELPKVLETTAGVLRETMRVEGVMESKTSEGKAQVRGHGPAAVRLRRRAAGDRSRVDGAAVQRSDRLGASSRSPACSKLVGDASMVRKLTRIDV